MAQQSTQQIESLIQSLDNKILSINNNQVDVPQLASRLHDNLRGYVSTLVSNSISKRREEESEANKPRSIIKRPMPIDIVSVSPSAAGQIVAALRAAGLGKYKLNIRNMQQSIESKQSDGSGLIGSLIAVIGKAVSWVATTLVRFMKPLKLFLGSILKSLATGLPMMLRALFKRSGLMIAAGAIAGSALFASFDDESDMSGFDETINSLERTADIGETSPGLLFGQSTDLETTVRQQSETPVNEEKMTPSLEKETPLQDATSVDSADLQPDDAPTGNYISPLINNPPTSGSSSSSSEIRTLIESELNTLEKTFDTTYNSPQDKQLKQDFMQQAINGTLTQEWFEKNLPHSLTNNDKSSITPKQFAQNTYNNISGFFPTTDNTVSLFEDSQFNAIAGDVMNMTSDQRDSYYNSDKFFNQVSSVNPPREKKSPVPVSELQTPTDNTPVQQHTTFPEITSNTSSLSRYTIAPTPPDTSPTTEAPHSTDMTNLERLIQQHLLQSETGNEQLKAIRDALMNSNSESMTVNNNQSQDEATISVENVRALSMQACVQNCTH